MYYRTYFIIAKGNEFEVKYISMGYVTKIGSFTTEANAKKFIDSKRKGI